MRGSAEKDVEKQMINTTVKGNDIKILQEKNPEVFSILPNPGHSTSVNYGAATSGVKPSDSRRMDNSMNTSRLRDTTTSWGRIQTAMQEVWRQKELQMATEEDGINFDNMLPVAMSTIILLATTPDAVPMEYYMWTEKYLSCIKDENGYRPYNIDNMLHMIHDRCKDLGYVWDPEWGLMPPELPDDRISRKRLEKEKHDSKKEAKDIKKKEHMYDKHDSERERLAEKRQKARRKDSEKVQKEMEKQANGNEVKDKDSKDSKGSKDSKESRGSKSSRASSGSVSRREKEMKTENTVNNGNVGAEAASPTDENKPGSRRASDKEKSGSQRNSASRQAGGGRPLSGTSHKSYKDESESLSSSATIL